MNMKEDFMGACKLEQVLYYVDRMLCTSTLNKYGAPVNNIWKARQVSTLDVAGHPSLERM